MDLHLDRVFWLLGRLYTLMTVPIFTYKHASGRSGRLLCLRSEAHESEFTIKRSI